MGRGDRDIGDEKSNDDQKKKKKAENVEKMRAARERCKTGYWQPHKQEEDRAERGKETEKRVR